MPFIDQLKRFKFDRGDEFLMDYGDRCYIFYKNMVDEWRKEPRWSTAHVIYRNMVRVREEDEDMEIAKQLAWQVFFNLHILEYEKKKRDENGDI